MSTVNRDQPDALGVTEMVRIMDVATAIRQDRELVEEQLNLDQLKDRLRDRLIAAAKVTGEDVTAEEVDAAVAQYYRSLHAYHDPPWSFPVALAHLWVRRQEILLSGGLLLGALTLVWWLFLSPAGPLTVTGRTRQQTEAKAAEIARRVDTVRAIAKDPSVSDEVSRLVAEAGTYRSQLEPKKLETVRKTLSNLEIQLRDEYTISIVSAPGRQSAVDRSITDYLGRKITTYYVIVEARTPDGKVLRRRIHNSENNRDDDVNAWGERVSKAVYDRLARDKKEDGILNETTFAVKRKGFPTEDISLPGPDGRPITRTGQITRW